MSLKQLLPTFDRLSIESDNQGFANCFIFLLDNFFTGACFSDKVCRALMTLLILSLTSSLMSWLKSIFSRSFTNKSLSKWEKSRKYFVSWHRGSRFLIVQWTGRWSVISAKHIPAFVILLLLLLLLRVSHSSVVRASNRYLEGHGFDSRWGLRKFFFWVFRLENASHYLISVILTFQVTGVKWARNLHGRTNSNFHALSRFSRCLNF